MPICTAPARSGKHREVALDSVGDLAEPLPDPLPEVEPERLQQALGELTEVFRTPVILYYSRILVTATLPNRWICRWAR